MDETIIYSDFKSDSDSDPIFMMDDDLSTDESDGKLNNDVAHNNQNQDNVSKFIFLIFFFL